MDCQRFISMRLPSASPHPVIRVGGAAILCHLDTWSSQLRLGTEEVDRVTANGVRPNNSRMLAEEGSGQPGVAVVGEVGIDTNHIDSPLWDQVETVGRVLALAMPK